MPPAVALVLAAVVVVAPAAGLVLAVEPAAVFAVALAPAFALYPAGTVGLLSVLVPDAVPAYPLSLAAYSPQAVALYYSHINPERYYLPFPTSLRNC